MPLLRHLLQFCEKKLLSTTKEKQEIKVDWCVGALCISALDVLLVPVAHGGPVNDTFAKSVELEAVFFTINLVVLNDSFHVCGNFKWGILLFYS